jgi:undecaprenyl-diphosphatase
LATVVVFRKQVWALLRALPRVPRFLTLLFQKGHLAIGDDPEVWLLILIFVSTAVTGTIGVVFHDPLKATFTSVSLVACTMFVTGCLLFFSQSLSEKRGKSTVTATLKDAALIGLMQGAAILPGLSRSGSTIAAGLFVGFARPFAGEYSFLISLPAILGAVVVESRHGVESLAAPLSSVMTGFSCAFAFGLISLKLLLGWIRAGHLRYFAYYCWGASLVAAFLAFRS